MRKVTIGIDPVPAKLKTNPINVKVTTRRDDNLMFISAACKSHCAMIFVAYLSKSLDVKGQPPPYLAENFAVSSVSVCLLSFAEFLLRRQSAVQLSVFLSRIIVENRGFIFKSIHLSDSSKREPIFVNLRTEGVAKESKSCISPGNLSGNLEIET